MQNLSNFIQLFGAVIYTAFIFNLIKLVFNQIKIK